MIGDLVQADTPQGTIYGIRLIATCTLWSNGLPEDDGSAYDYTTLKEGAFVEAAQAYNTMLNYYGQVAAQSILADLHKRAMARMGEVAPGDSDPRD